MPRLTFYRNHRRDGLSRTALELDGEEIAGYYSPHEPDDSHDPRICWWLDVRVEGPMIPRDPQAALSWFFDRDEDVLTALRAIPTDRWAVSWYRAGRTGLPAIAACSMASTSDKRAPAGVAIADDWTEIKRRFHDLAHSGPGVFRGRHGD